MIAAVVLAGGESRRMGFPKLTLEHAGQSLLAGAVHKAKQVSELVVVVVGAYPEIYTPVAQQAGATVVENPAWSSGLASSLQAGVAALPESVEGALVLLADQPFVTPEHLQALVDTYRTSKAPLALSAYEGVEGAPAFVGRELFAEVATLTGDRGLRALGGARATVPLERPFDVDTPEDAARLKSV